MVALASVPVSLSRDRKTTTDRQGEFRFESVSPGAHTVSTELAGIPAEYVLAETSERTIAIMPGDGNVYNLRVVKMGRILGRVTYLDVSQGDDHPVMRPLTDARITVGALDTYTESNGLFVAGDLPPAVYEIRVDPNTIPKGYVSTPEMVQITVNPGQTVENVQFTVAPRPRVVIEAEPSAP